MSTWKLFVLLVLTVNFWLVFGCAMPVPEMVSGICATILKAEAWTIGIFLIFSALFFYDQMVLVVEGHQEVCQNTCYIAGTNAKVPLSQNLPVRVVLRSAWRLSAEKYENALQRVHHLLQTNV